MCQPGDNIYRLPSDERLTRALKYTGARVRLVVERRSHRTVHYGTVVSVAMLNYGKTGDVIVLRPIRGVTQVDLAFSLAQVVTIDPAGTRTEESEYGDESTVN